MNGPRAGTTRDIETFDRRLDPERFSTGRVAATDKTRSPIADTARVVTIGYVGIVAVLVAAGFVVTKVLLDGPLGRADESTTRWLSEHRTGALNAISSVLSKSADTIGAIAIALVVIAVLAVVRWWREIAILAGALAMELLCFLAINTIVDRPRPDVVPLGSVPSTSSFPSGHTAATVVIYGCIAVFTAAATHRAALRALAWTAAIVMPLAVAFARVYRGMHHPLDVAGGLVMGVLVLVVVFAAARAADHEEAVEPAARPEPAVHATARGAA